MINLPIICGILVWFFPSTNIFTYFFDTPMGGCISPVLASIVMNFLLDQVLDPFLNNISFLHKYIDDLMCGLLHRTTLITILKFTLEVKSNNSVLFLDLS